MSEDAETISDYEWIITLQRNLKTQDNRCTADPLFLVQEEERIWHIDPSCTDDGYIWQSQDEPEIFYESTKELLEGEEAPDNAEIDFRDEISLNGHRYERVHYKTIWKFVTAHFTEAAAQLYIDQNAHNLRNPRIYVSSQYRCWEWNKIRKMLVYAEVRPKDPQDRVEALEGALNLILRSAEELESSHLSPGNHVCVAEITRICKRLLPSLKEES